MPKYRGREVKLNKPFRLSMEESKNKITSAKTFFDRVQFNSAVYNSNLNLINRINNFDFNNALQFIKTQGISPNTSITDISLDPNAVI